MFGDGVPAKESVDCEWSSGGCSGLTDPVFEFGLAEGYLDSKIFGSVDFIERDVEDVTVFFVFLVLLVVFGIERLSDGEGLGSVRFWLISHLTNI